MNIEVDDNENSQYYSGDVADEEVWPQKGPDLSPYHEKEGPLITPNKTNYTFTMHSTDDRVKFNTPRSYQQQSWSAQQKSQPNECYYKLSPFKNEIMKEQEQVQQLQLLEQNHYDEKEEEEMVYLSESIEEDQDPEHVSSNLESQLSSKEYLLSGIEQRKTMLSIESESQLPRSEIFLFSLQKPNYSHMFQSPRQSQDNDINDIIVQASKPISYNLKLNKLKSYFSSTLPQTPSTKQHTSESQRQRQSPQNNNDKIEYLYQKKQRNDESISKQLFQKTLCISKNNQTSSKDFMQRMNTDVKMRKVKNTIVQRVYQNSIEKISPLKSNSLFTRLYHEGAYKTRKRTDFSIERREIEKQQIQTQKAQNNKSPKSSCQFNKSTCQISQSVREKIKKEIQNQNSKGKLRKQNDFIRKLALQQSQLKEQMNQVSQGQSKLRKEIEVSLQNGNDNENQTKRGINLIYQSNSQQKSHQVNYNEKPAYSILERK